MRGSSSTVGMGNKRKALREDADKVEEEWRDWSSLTEPLLLCIVSLFTTLHDFFAFRHVCRSWRSTAIPSLQTMSSQSPLILYYRPLGFFKTPTKTLFDVAHARHYLILPPYGEILGYSHGHFIVQLMEGSKSSRVTLIDFFTGARTRWFPTQQSIQKPYRFRLSSSPSSPSCLAIFLPKKYEAFQYCHTTDPPTQWKQWPKNDVEDILFFDNKLYVLTKSLQLWVLDPLSDPWDLVLLEASSPVPAVEAKRIICGWFLAESDGELLMVCNYYRCGSGRRLFIWRWSFESCGGWLTVFSLGLRSLFIDRRGFVGLVPIPENSGFRQNCIYLLGWNDSCFLYSLGEDRFHYLSGALPYVYEKVDSPLWILPSLI